MPTDERTKMTKLTVAFSDSANESKTSARTSQTRTVYPLQEATDYCGLGD